MTDPQATFKSALWNHAGKILEYILMYLISILIARGLGVQENGTFVGLFSISQLLLVLTSFGLEISLNKHIPQLGGASREEQLRCVFRHALAVRFILIFGSAAVLYAALHFFATLFPPLFSQYIWLVLAYAGIRSIVSLLAIVMIAELQTRVSSVINVMTRVLEVILISLIVAGRMTAIDIFIIFLSTGILQVAAYIVAGRARLFGRSLRIAVAPIIMFGGVYWANTVVEYFLGRQGDVLFLTMLLPDSTQASLYDVAFAISQLASLSMTMGLGGITLAMSAKLALQSSELLERFYGFMVRLTSLLSIPLYAFILFNPTSVLSVLYSSKYLSAAGIVQGIAAFRIAGRLFGGPENAEFLLARSRVSKLVGIGIIGAVVNAGLDLLLIPTRGATGAVIGSGVGNLIVNLLGALTVLGISSARIQWRFWLRVALSTLTASLVCSLLIPSDGIVLIAVQVIVYAVLTLALFAVVKPLTSGDNEWLSRIDRRVGTLVQHFARREPVILSSDPT